MSPVRVIRRYAESPAFLDHVMGVAFRADCSWPKMRFPRRLNPTYPDTRRSHDCGSELILLVVGESLPRMAGCTPICRLPTSRRARRLSIIAIREGDCESVAERGLRRL